MAGVCFPVYQVLKPHRAPLSNSNYHALKQHSAYLSPPSCGIFIGDMTMTQNEFLALCLEHCVDPSIALENPAIVEALKARDAQAVATILTNEF